MQPAQARELALNPCARIAPRSRLTEPTPHIPADALLIFPDPPGRVYYLFSHITLEKVSPPLWHSMHCAVICFLKLQKNFYCEKFKP